MTTAVSPSSSVSPRVKLTTRQRACLEQITRGQTNAQRLVRRANILLALDTGASHCHITRQMHLNRGTVRAWHRRWLALTPKLERIEAEGSSDKALTTVIVASLTDQPRAGAPATFTAEQIVQIVAVACEAPADSGRRAAVLGGTPCSLNALPRVPDDVAWAAVTRRSAITRSQ